jgi:hypothetical protein
MSMFRLPLTARKDDEGDISNMIDGKTAIGLGARRNWQRPCCIVRNVDGDNEEA